MKKKLMLAMAIVACAVGAQAATYMYRQKNNPWGGDSDLREGDMPYMQVYGMSASQMSAMIGKTLSGGNITDANALSYMSQINEWISDNFALAKSTMADDGVTFAASEILNVCYQRTTYDASNWRDLQYVVNFYTGDKVGGAGKAAFRVTVLKQDEDQIIGGNSGKDGTIRFGAWQTTTVPEPTSGLLMLLGVAGLALKRKRA